MLDEREAYPHTTRSGLLLRAREFPATAPFFGLFWRMPVRTMMLSTVVNTHGGSGTAAADVWEVQRNRRAHRVEGVHDVVWGPRADATGEEAHLWETGSSVGVGFVDALQPGDRVAVLARAQVSWSFWTWIVGWFADVVFIITSTRDGRTVFAVLASRYAFLCSRRNISGACRRSTPFVFEECVPASCKYQ